MGAKTIRMMTPSKLLKDVRSQWPKTIEFNASVNKHGEWEPIWEIVRTYESLEEEIDSENEPWLCLANWCFNQAITATARLNYLSGKSLVCRDDVTLVEFDKRVVRNLQEDSWKKERSEYQALGGNEEEKYIGKDSF